ncbi:MAG: hypothetical protein F6K42_15295 [Leptolyngbya sp. SIO1D8]|nr:hypothetical protein [Leptolyngbya sp. SIO1D8]
MGKYDPRRPVYVVPFNASAVRYGFNTNVDAADGVLLGHKNAFEGTVTGLVFGANAPKPARATRRRATGSVSSYCDYAEVAALRGAGWTVGNGRIRRGGSTPRGRVVAVTFNGISYAWVIPNDTFANVGADAAALGIRETTTNDFDLVFGANKRSQPPRASTVKGTGDNTNIITTFYDPSGGVLPDGWSQASSGIDVTQTP